MDGKIPPRSEEIDEAEIAERLQWLLRLRWLIVPVFVAVDLAYGVLVRRRGARLPRASPGLVGPLAIA